MRKKVFTTKSADEMPDQRDLEAADALLELSSGGGLLLENYLPSPARKRGMPHIADCEVDIHSEQGVILFGMDDKLIAAASKRPIVRFVVGKSSEKNHKKRRSEKDFDPYEDRELCDGHELIRSLCRKSKQGVEVCGTLQQEDTSMKHLKNKKAEANWKRTSYVPHSHISNSNDLCGSSKPMLIDKPTKRQPSTSITPLRHPGFSFSIVHLLSAVRIALITPHSRQNDLINGNCVKGDYKRQKHMMDIHNKAPEGSLGLHKKESSIIASDRSVQKNLPSLTTDEIVHRVRLTPGDARILELSMPLRDLVRGVLMIFTSKTAPPGAKIWKALTVYSKISKTWSWIGPVPASLPHIYRIEEEISSNAWGVPCRTLSKLVDFFAHWLKASQDVFQKIQSLPPPPLALMQCPSVNERFNDGRARKNLVTLSPSCEEVRAYFRREETLRYSIAELAFSYTTLDGKKSTVAPLRRCSGKPAARIRDHFILKQDRPPQFTVLCLVRDAAARLPDRLGTRLDICTLVRDSQFILEDVSDLQISQVISGALDRLHYEVDPCVRFHKTWRVWVYLHGDREEEDFDQDCTSSRKVRKRDTAKLAGKSDTGQGSIQTSHLDRQSSQLNP